MTAARVEAWPMRCISSARLAPVAGSEVVAGVPPGSVAVEAGQAGSGDRRGPAADLLEVAPSQDGSGRAGGDEGISISADVGLGDGAADQAEQPQAR